jgi:hypothetical protein
MSGPKTKVVLSGAARPEPARYTDQQRTEVKRCLRHLNADEAAVEDELDRLEWGAGYYQYYTLMIQQFKLDDRSWATIAKRATELEELLRLRSEAEAENSNGGCRPHHHYILALQELRHDAIFRSRTWVRFGPTRPRVLFQSFVLHCWTRMGGTLKFSRHPETRKITGPLARYFFAATESVIGGSLESLPDVVARQRSWEQEARGWIEIPTIAADDEGVNGESADRKIK